MKIFRNIVSLVITLYHGAVIIYYCEKEYRENKRKSKL